ncbi:MAG TPA: DUF4365 domain-containing protein [Streptosporangiaceae bacterium]|nr:DUF4365 domain-containing protein [Streptosporangiaceae bacterium]
MRDVQTGLRGTARGRPPFRSLSPHEEFLLKKIDASAQIGDGGIALIHQLVNKMGFTWHERKTDAGIDGEIELRNPVTGEVANRLILIQSKASDRRFPGENDRSFHFLCKQADVAYWMSADVPVLLICSHPQTGEAWWMHVQGWFSDPAHRASGRIDFDKRTQRFDTDAAHRLLNLADPHGRAHVTAAEYRDETLTSNLLTVTIPGVLFSTATPLRRAREVYERQGDAGGEVRDDFLVRDGRLYSWLPPHETALASSVTGTTDAIDTTDCAAEPARQRLVNLLNNALRQDVTADCDWHPGRKVLYFRATEDLTPRRIRSASGRQKLVFNPKPKKNAPDEISYCQHAALEWQFLQVDRQWLCALTPTYHYTRDGHRDSLYLSELLTGIKQRERNPAVYHLTRMWAAYLHGDDGVLDPRETILSYGDVMTLTADRAINDAVWLADPRAAPDSDLDQDTENDGPGDELRLFEVEA